MENNYCKNLKMLRSCERFYKIIFWVYFVSCVPTALTTLIYGTLYTSSVDDYNVGRFLITFILLLVIFVTGYLSVYRKEALYKYLPIPFALILSLFNCFDDMFFLNVLTCYSMPYIPLIITLASYFVLTNTHKKYCWLEQQEGFPYFNELLEKNKNKTNEYINNNPYQQAMERYKNSSSGKMDDI
ncbi:MAG: hypothetical protein K2J08_09395 [Ruminococcus sp.]|nr:hypothetical protein [Ruminococcus sp.]